MSDKPGDFFLGTIDFFGILVPGVALLILQGSKLASLADISLPESQRWSTWVPALVAAYVAGHFLLGLGVPMNRLAATVSPEARDLYFQAVRDRVPLPPNVVAKRSHVFNAVFSFVRIVSPSALAEIERQAAEYKLFRSLTLVFLLDALLTLMSAPNAWGRVALDCLLAVAAGARFLYLLVWTQRLAFEFFDLLTRENPPYVRPRGSAN